MQLTEKDIWEEVERLKAIAINNAVANHEDILSKKYEWELGVDIYRIMTEDCYMYLKDNAVKFTALGYPVRINYENKTIIKLWKEVQ